MWNVLVVDYSASTKSLIVDGKIGTIIFKAVTGIQNHVRHERSESARKLRAALL